MRETTLIFVCAILYQSSNAISGSQYEMIFNIHAPEPSRVVEIKLLDENETKASNNPQTQESSFDKKEFCRPLIEEADLKRLKQFPVDTESPLPSSSPCLLPSKRESSLEPIYIITSTYRRPEQIPELTRLAQTLMLVENVHWLVIEDYKVLNPRVTELLNRSGLKFHHLNARTPKEYEALKSRGPRRDLTRDRALAWIQANATNGVVYLANGANTYDIDIFNEIRGTKKLSMFPVGLASNFHLSSPVIKNGLFAGYYDGWVRGRKYPIDISGFAVNVKFLHQRPKAKLSEFSVGHASDGFLRSLEPFKTSEIEFLANNCTRILVWRTEFKNLRPTPPLDFKKYGNSNIVELKKLIN